MHIEHVSELLKKPIFSRNHAISSIKSKLNLACEATRSAALLIHVPPLHAMARDFLRPHTRHLPALHCLCACPTLHIADYYSPRYLPNQCPCQFTQSHLLYLHELCPGPITTKCLTCKNALDRCLYQGSPNYTYGPSSLLSICVKFYEGLI